MKRYNAGFLAISSCAGSPRLVPSLSQKNTTTKASPLDTATFVIMNQTRSKSSGQERFTERKGRSQPSIILKRESGKRNPAQHTNRNTDKREISPHAAKGNNLSTCSRSTRALSERNEVKPVNNERKKAADETRGSKRSLEQKASSPAGREKGTLPSRTSLTASSKSVSKNTTATARNSVPTTAASHHEVLDSTAALWGSPQLKALLLAQQGPPPRTYTTFHQSSVVLRGAGLPALGRGLRHGRGEDDEVDEDEDADEDDDFFDELYEKREEEGGVVVSAEVGKAAIMIPNSDESSTAESKTHHLISSSSHYDHEEDIMKESSSEKDRIVDDILSDARRNKKGGETAAEFGNTSAAASEFTSSAMNDVRLTFFHSHRTEIIDHTFPPPPASSSSSSAATKTRNSNGAIPFASSSYLILTEGGEGPVSGASGRGGGVGAASAMTEGYDTLFTDGFSSSGFYGISSTSTASSFSPTFSSPKGIANLGDDDGYRQQHSKVPQVQHHEGKRKENNVEHEARLVAEDVAHALRLVERFKKRERTKMDPTTGEESQRTNLKTVGESNADWSSRERNGGKDVLASAHPDPDPPPLHLHVSINTSRIPITTLQLPTFSIAPERRNEALEGAKRLLSATVRTEGAMKEEDLRPFFASIEHYQKAIEVARQRIEKADRALTETKEKKKMRIVGEEKRGVTKKNEDNTTNYNNNNKNNNKNNNNNNNNSNGGREASTTTCSRNDEHLLATADLLSLAVRHPHHYAIIERRGPNSKERPSFASSSSSSPPSLDLVALDPTLVVIPMAPTSKRTDIVKARVAREREADQIMLSKRRKRRQNERERGQRDGRRYRNVGEDEFDDSVPSLPSFRLVEASSESTVPSCLVTVDANNYSNNSPTCKSNPPQLRDQTNSFADKVRQFCIFQTSTLRRLSQRDEHSHHEGKGSSSQTDSSTCTPPRVRYSDVFAEVTLFPVSVAGLGYAVEELVVKEIAETAAALRKRKGKENGGEREDAGLRKQVEAEEEEVAIAAAEAILGAIFISSPFSAEGHTTASTTPLSSPFSSASPLLAAPSLLEAIRSICRVNSILSPSVDARSQGGGGGGKRSPMLIKVPYLSDIALVGCETLVGKNKLVASSENATPVVRGESLLPRVVHATLKIIAERQHVYIDALIRDRLGVPTYLPIAKNSSTTSVSVQASVEENNDEMRAAAQPTRELLYVGDDAMSHQNGGNSLLVTTCTATPDLGLATATSPLLTVNVPSAAATATRTAVGIRNGMVRGNGGNGEGAPYQVVPRSVGELFPLGLGRDFVYMSPPSPLQGDEQQQQGVGGGVDLFTPSLLCDVACRSLFVGATCGRRVWWEGHAMLTSPTRSTRVVVGGSKDPQSSLLYQKEEEEEIDEKETATALALSNALAYPNNTTALRSVLRATTSPLTPPFSPQQSSSSSSSVYFGPLDMFTLPIEVTKSIAKRVQQYSKKPVAVTDAILRVRQQHMGLYYKLMQMIIEGGEFKRAALQKASIANTTSQNANVERSDGKVVAVEEEEFFALAPATAIFGSAYGDLAFTIHSGIDGDLSIAGNATNTSTARRGGLLGALEGLVAKTEDEISKTNQPSSKAVLEAAGITQQEDEALSSSPSSSSASLLIMREPSDIIKAIEHSVIAPALNQSAWIRSSVTSSSTSTESSIHVSSPFPSSDAVVLFPELLECGNLLKQRLVSAVDLRDGRNNNSFRTALPPRTASFASNVIIGVNEEEVDSCSPKRERQSLSPSSSSLFRSPRTPTFSLKGSNAVNDLPFAKPSYSRDVRESVNAMVSNIIAKTKASTSGLDLAGQRSGDRIRHAEKTEGINQQGTATTTERKKVDIFVMLLRQKLAHHQSTMFDKDLVESLASLCRERGIDTANFVTFSDQEMSALVRMATTNATAAAKVRDVSSPSSGGSSSATNDNATRDPLVALLELRFAIQKTMRGGGAEQK